MLKKMPALFIWAYYRLYDITSNVVEMHVYLNMSAMSFIIIILKHVPFKSVLCRKSFKRENDVFHFKGKNALHCKSAKSFRRHFQIINILLLSNPSVYF